MPPEPNALRARFHQALENIDLGSSGQGKFDRSGFNRLMAEIAGVDLLQVYTAGTSSSKAYNILNRLAQGKALRQRHTLGVVVLGRPSAVGDGKRYARRMVGKSRNFDSVALVTRAGGTWQVVAVVEGVGGEIAARIQAVFPDLQLLEPEPEVRSILGGIPEVTSVNRGAAPEPVASPIDAALDVLSEDDPVLRLVKQLLEDGFGGVVFRGPPGTSKSWYANLVAASLVDGDPSRMRTVQFHPSYQYEDFVEGFVPTSNGTFRLVGKHLWKACKAADELDGQPFVLVIDEMSRADPARVLGEALTYIEASKRGQTFHLASGRRMQIPSNLLIIGTMNVFDRGVAQMESALERRLAFVDMPPSVDTLKQILEKNEVPESAREAIIAFFRWAQNQRNPYTRIGHAYFISVVDLPSLNRLWEHQLRFVFERAFPTAQEEGLRETERQWQRIRDAEWVHPQEPAEGTTGGDDDVETGRSDAIPGE